MTTLADYMVPTTSLQAVNIILEAIGQTPVASLTHPGTDAETALKRLGEANVETQAEGWSYNTDEGFIIDPGTDGSITLPANTLRVRPAWSNRMIPISGGVPSNPPSGPSITIVMGTGPGRALVRRGMRIYDRVQHTFAIGYPVRLDLTSCLDYEDIPQGARWYIACKAARRMTAGATVSGTAYQFTKADEDEARLRMEQEEDETLHMEGMADNPHIRFMRQR